MPKELKILELTNFSAGICGVWQRVKQESMELIKRGYSVKVFSSNATKGSDNIAKDREYMGDLEIRRFAFKKLGGESFMSWNFEEEALQYSPDIIIAHSYRHMHTTKALRLASKLRKEGKKCKIFLVTHAPFIESNATRSLLASFFVGYYDLFIGPKIINKFDKVIAITKWEMPLLKKLGLKEEKLEYIPNGIPDEFFKIKKNTKEEHKILFLGRISPVKALEVLIGAMSLIRDKNLSLELVGPAEQDYLIELKRIIAKEKTEDRVKFSQPIYDLKKKIEKMDSCKIFVLPSKTEAMPQSIIEAMARGKLVISSDTRGAKEVIVDSLNGFIFTRGDKNILAIKIDNCLKDKNVKIKQKAIKSVETFKLSNIINKLEKLF